MSYRSFLVLPCLVLSFGAVFISEVQATDYHSPRTAGLGGAGHAGPILTDAIYMNPGMMPFLPAYSVSISHNGFNGPDDTEPKGRVQNASIQDGTNSLFQAGVGYTRKSYGKMVNLGASTRIFEKYGVGVGGKFLFGSESRESFQDATVSMVGTISDWLQTGFIIDNVMSPPKSRQWNEGREIIFATKINLQKILLVYFDPHYVPSKAGSHVGYEMGLELPIMADLYIRAGLNQDSFQPHLGVYGKGFGFGFGWAAPRMSIDVSLSRTMEPVRTNNMLVSITVI